MSCQDADAIAAVVGEASRRAMSALGEADLADLVGRLERVTMRGVLPERTVLLVQIAVHASVTGRSGQHVRRYVRDALEHRVAPAEIAAVFRLCAVLGIHSMAQAIPILSRQLDRAGQSLATTDVVPPRIGSMKSRGDYNTKWDQLLSWGPEWLDAFLAVGYADEIRAALGRETFELLCIAIDASVTHLYNPGTERHVEAALACGIEPSQILAVLELVSIQGLVSVDAGMTILDEEVRLSKQ